VIRSAVTVSLVHEAKGGPFVFWHDLAAACKKAKELGFDAIEVFPPDPHAVDPRELRNPLDDNGLSLAAVGTGAGWVRHQLTLTSPDPGVREKAKAYVRAVIDFAGPFGAPAIIGSMQGRHGPMVDAPTATSYLSEALEQLGEHAKQQGVPLLFEPLNRYETNMVNTVEAGVKLLSSLSTRNVLLLVDLFHMNIEEVSISEALKVGAAHIGHVHFVDSNRRPAGLGHLDYEPIAKALKEIGYDRYASAEALPYPDSDGAARQTIEAFRRYFRT
jgi:sugar phosphate isomerase/epimerase